MKSFFIFFIQIWITIVRPAVPPPYGYKIDWYEDMPIDHFAYADNRTFRMRYLINDTYFKTSGPIFFYCGNEGNVETFAQNTGFMWDLAPTFNAMIVFAEHRYYGETLPFGKKSYENIENLGSLSSEQALADYAEFLRWLKTTRTDAGASPVVAFGGSYGGMLAAWMRMKYPHIVAGAIAASAPILQFTGVTECWVFNDIVTRTFRNSGKHCDQCIKNSWPAIRTLANSSEGREELSKIFNLCPNSTLNESSHADALVGWLNDIYGNLAMVDYPYEANFLNPVPAWPVKVSVNLRFSKSHKPPDPIVSFHWENRAPVITLAACSHLTKPNASNEELLSAIYKAVSVFMNYTGNVACYTFDSADAALGNGAIGWTFQTCTEMVMPMCSNGTDMFEISPWNFTAFSDSCLSGQGVRPRMNWATTEYGADRLEAASNIVFSNGNLDPWSGGGVLKSVSDSVVSVYIEGGAHHYDLRGKHANDTKYVKEARRTEAMNIRKWLKQYYRNLKRTVSATNGLDVPHFKFPSLFKSFD